MTTRTWFDDVLDWIWRFMRQRTGSVNHSFEGGIGNNGFIEC